MRGSTRLKPGDQDANDEASQSVESLHRFHGYCARFSSELAERAILEYTEAGESVFDPFCGSGTSLVAGLARGRPVVGADIDALAGMLSRVKCGARRPGEYERWRSGFARQVEAAVAEVELSWKSRTRAGEAGETLTLGRLRIQLPVFEEINYWFPPQIVAALAAIAGAARACTDEHFSQVGLVALSACILAKWPATLSYAMDVDHTRPHRRVQRISLARALATYLRRLDRTIACLGQLQQAYARVGFGDAGRRPGRVVCPHDARAAVEGASVSEGSQALVVTSPPYFNAVDYPRAHRMSVCWMNGHSPAELVSRRDYVGLRHAGGFDAAGWLKQRRDVRRVFPRHVSVEEARGQRLCAFFADLESAVEQAGRALRPGGHAVWVIADNVVRGKRVASGAVLERLGRRTGLELVRSEPRAIATDRRRFPVGPFGFDGPMTHEHVVVFRRPARGKGGGG